MLIQCRCYFDINEGESKKYPTDNVHSKKYVTLHFAEAIYVIVFHNCGLQ